MYFLWIHFCIIPTIGWLFILWSLIWFSEKYLKYCDELSGNNFIITTFPKNHAYFTYGITFSLHNNHSQRAFSSRRRRIEYTRVSLERFLNSRKIFSHFTSVVRRLSWYWLTIIYNVCLPYFPFFVWSLTSLSHYDMMPTRRRSSIVEQIELISSSLFLRAKENFIF